MFKLYKYKRISVFLLTFFMLSNGFASRYEDDEVDKYLARQRHNSASPVRPLFPTIDTYTPSAYTYTDYSIDDPSESCKEKTHNNFIHKNNIEQIKNTKAKSSKLKKDNKEESQKNKIMVEEDLYDDSNSSESSEFQEDIDGNTFINFINNANSFINNANNFINEKKKKRKADLLDSEEKPSELEEKSIKKTPSKKVKTLSRKSVDEPKNKEKSKKRVDLIKSEEKFLKPKKRWIIRNQSKKVKILPSTKIENLENNKKRIPKKNKSFRKRKTPLNEIEMDSCIAESEEEILKQKKVSKKKNQTKKLKTVFEKSVKKKSSRNEEISSEEMLDVEEEKNKNQSKKNRISVIWTEKMEERLTELKSEKNPNTHKNYTYKEIAKEMTNIFTDCRFTERSVALKWAQIGGDEIKKRKEKVDWTKKMEDYLTELKSKKKPDTHKDYTYPEVAEIMNKKFKVEIFTDRNIGFKWKQIGIIKSTTDWTDEIKKRLGQLKKKKKPRTKKTYTNEEIAEFLNEEYDVDTFTASSVRQKWTKIAGKAGKKNIEWTEKMETHLTDLKKKRNGPKKQPYSDLEIAQMMCKEFKGTKFSEAIIHSKWANMKKNKNKK